MSNTSLSAMPVTYGGRNRAHGWGTNRFGGQGATALEEVLSANLGHPTRFVWRNTDHTADYDFRVDWRLLFHPDAPYVLFAVWFPGDRHMHAYELPAAEVDQYILKRLPDWNVRPPKEPTE